MKDWLNYYIMKSGRGFSSGHIGDYFLATIFTSCCSIFSFNFKEGFLILFIIAVKLQFDRGGGQASRVNLPTLWEQLALQPK